MEGLPVGFRFDPTDEELVIHYLGNHVSGEPLPCDIVAIADVYATEPWNLLPSDVDDGKSYYYFTQRTRKYNRGSRAVRAAGQGTWRPYGVEAVINSGGDVVGRKRSLAYGVADKRNTGWIMHEYELTGDESSFQEWQEWVLCVMKRSVVGSSRSLFKNRTSCGKKRKRGSSETIGLVDDSLWLTGSDQGVVAPNVAEDGILLIKGATSTSVLGQTLTMVPNVAESIGQTLTMVEKPSDEFDFGLEFDFDFDVSQYLVEDDQLPESLWEGMEYPEFELSSNKSVKT